MADHGAARPPPDNPPAGGTAATAEGWVRKQADLCLSVQMSLLNCLCAAVPPRERGGALLRQPAVADPQLIEIRRDF